MMKKIVIIMVLIAVGGVASADIKDGDFQDNLIHSPVSSSMNWIDHNNAGWVSSMGLSTNGANYSFEMEGQFFGAADHYYLGQIWTESSVLSSTSFLCFDVISQAYTDTVTNPVVTVEFLSFDGSSGTWRKVGLVNNNGLNGGWALIGTTQHVDISGGVGSYQTGAVDLSGNTGLIYGLRIGLSSDNDGTVQDNFVIDNISIYSGQEEQRGTFYQIR